MTSPLLRSNQTATFLLCFACWKYGIAFAEDFILHNTGQKHQQWDRGVPAPSSVRQCEFLCTPCFSLAATPGSLNMFLLLCGSPLQCWKYQNVRAQGQEKEKIASTNGNCPPTQKPVGAALRWFRMLALTILLDCVQDFKFMCWIPKWSTASKRHGLHRT